MFSIYAVRRVNGRRARHFLGHEEDEFAANQAANVATCVWADYAYVKDTRDGSVTCFFRSPEYEEVPLPDRLPIQLIPEEAANQ